MTTEELKTAAEKALSKGDGRFILVVPRPARGYKIRVFKGLSGVVMETQSKPPQTRCMVYAKDVLKSLEQERNR